MEKKPWYQSKMLWVNLIVIVAIIVQSATGEELIDAKAQAAILGVINLILRIVTKQGLTK